MLSPRDDLNAQSWHVPMAASAAIRSKFTSPMRVHLGVAEERVQRNISRERSPVCPLNARRGVRSSLEMEKLSTTLTGSENFSTRSVLGLRRKRLSLQPSVALK